MHVRGVDSPIWIRLGSSDGAVLEEVMIRGVYQRAIDVLSNPGLILDLGANFGASVVLWKSHFPAATVVAVEPDPDNFATLARNTARYGSTVVPLQVCAARETATAWLSEGGPECAFVMERSAGAGRRAVSTMSIPDILARGAPDGARVDLLKCDIEGAEAEVFAACSQWIDRVGAMVVELHAPYSRADFAHDLQQSGKSFQFVDLPDTGGNGMILALATDAN